METTFAGAVRVCAENGISEITLLVPVKGGFPNTVVATFLGNRVTKTLCKGQSVKIADDLTMNLESSKTFSPYKSYGMVIGVYLSQKDQTILDSINSAKAIVLLPWTEEEGRVWMSTCNPNVLGKSTWQTPQTGFAPDVEAALLRLTRGINLSTGLSHPSDKESAKRTFVMIKKAGHQPEPEEIRKWALRNNWRPKDANTFMKLATKYFG